MSSFNEREVLNKITHFLPAQAPLKDFVHHNTLHAFQDLNFFEALRKSAVIFGNRTTLSLKEFRNKYSSGKISQEIVNAVIKNSKPTEEFEKWKLLMLSYEEPTFLIPRIGNLRKRWQTKYSIDMDGIVRPNFYRLINSYLDQGIAFEGLPKQSKGLLDAILYIQNNSLAKIFHSKKAVQLLGKEDKSLTELLNIIVGDENYYAQYLLDQQYSHPGLSGMVAAIEKKPDALYSKRPIKLFELIYLELLFELEALETYVDPGFKPLATNAEFPPEDIFSEVPSNEYWEILELWQEAFELTYHDQVLAGILSVDKKVTEQPKVQAFFCIDDREESIRRNIEQLFPECETFGTPAHFNILAKFKPENAEFSTQICPGNATPTHIIKEKNRKLAYKRDVIFLNHSHKFFEGFFISQTVGFWSTIQLMRNIFLPKENVAQYNARKDHMDYHSELIYENINGEQEEGLQVGFTINEMAGIVKAELSKSGLTSNFAPLIYFFGHGGSSTNNPYFAGYNCGACSGRPGTVNARLFAQIANRKDVREKLKEKGIEITETTHFIGGYHDTTQDTFTYFDENELPEDLKSIHEGNKTKFLKALSLNAKERARQFLQINTNSKAEKVHKLVKKRALSLFESRPEYNHSNNALYIIGPRSLTKNLFLDQRAFLSSYDYKTDPEGELLEKILNAGTGICGGINLEYFFSTVDNEKLGAGSKLPQNVIGLYSVANGVKGDLRPGLPWQMIDVHDPVRLLTIVESTPEIVLKALKNNPSTFEWYDNGWMKLAVYDPYTDQISTLKNGSFIPYSQICTTIEKINDLEKLYESSHENLPVYQI